MNDTAQTLIRSILKIGAGVFIMRGIGDQSTWEIVSAGAAALIGVIWGYLHRVPEARRPSLEPGIPPHPLLFLLALPLTRFLALGLLLALGATGCTTFKKGSGSNPLFDTATNYVPTVHLFTNEVVITNTVQVTNTVYLVFTNTVREVVIAPAPAAVTNVNVNVTNVTVLVTNVVYSMHWDTTNMTTVVTNIILQTNLVVAARTNLEPASVTVTPNATVTTVAGAAGAAFPPWGTIGATVFTAALGFIALQMQKKKTAELQQENGDIKAVHADLADDNAQSEQINALLMQAVQVAREIFKGTPQGQQLDEKYTAWLKSHQDAAGLIDLISAMVKENVDNPAAKAAADLLTGREVAAAPPTTA